MNTIEKNIKDLKTELEKYNCQLVAVSKTKPAELIKQAYQAGQRVFGENKVQELVEKHEVCPKDIQWHMIGHLQTNKVKYIAPFISLVHSVDSFKLLKEINKRAIQNKRTINCLLQVRIAKEETKFGLTENEIEEILEETHKNNMEGIKIVGFMGMATNTKDPERIKNEFLDIKHLFDKKRNQNMELTILSIGMSNDYPIALEYGSNLVRVGSKIFGERN